MTERYYNIDELLEMIDEPNRGSCEKLYSENSTIIERAKGSNIKHQAWEGGYLDHIRDTMNIAVRLYINLDICRTLPFSLSDSLLLLYLHDLEKPWKYGGTAEDRAEIEKFQDYAGFTKSIIEKYEFELTDEHWNGLKYVHGEGADYNPNRNVQGPLAAFVHSCDTMSARIWHEFPKVRNSW